MYSIYVTDKTNSEDLYIRLHHEKVSKENPNFHHDLESKLKDDKEKKNVSLYLIRWGFCLIPPQQTISFAVDLANDVRKYASLYAESKLWTMDSEMNCLRYGCLFVKGKHLTRGSAFYLTQANPTPVWIPAKQGDVLTINVIKVGSQAYLGRTTEGTPCRVTVSGNQLSTWTVSPYMHRSGDLLRDTGHEFVQAKAGDILPPHAVITGVSEPEGSLFLGMVGGQHPCLISREGGKIKHFCYDSKKFQNGEILILTNDPSIKVKV